MQPRPAQFVALQLKAIKTTISHGDASFNGRATVTSDLGLLEKERRRKRVDNGWHQESLPPAQRSLHTSIAPHWLSAPDLIRCDRRSIRLLCQHLAGRASSISGDSVENSSAWNNDKDRTGSNSRPRFLSKAVMAVDCLVHYWCSRGLEGTLTLTLTQGIKATCNLTWISKIYTWCRSWEFLTGSTIIQTKQKQK